MSENNTLADLSARCRDLAEWWDTGVLPDGPLRTRGEYLVETSRQDAKEHPGAARVAADEVVGQAVRFLAATTPPAPASETTGGEAVGEGWQDVEDWFADCIAATLDVDWGPRDAARYLVACMKAGEFPVQFFPPEPPKPIAAECPASFDGLHHVDSTMESGPYNCFHCERPMR